MAELLTACEWMPPDTLMLRLGEALPDEDFIVIGPTLYGHEHDIIIVSTGGLVVLHMLESMAEPSTLAESLKPKYARVAEIVQQSQLALGRFLRDEFPALRPAVRHLIVVADGTKLSSSGDMNLTCVGAKDEVIEAITNAFGSDPVWTIHPDRRCELANAFCRRRLTIRQRASSPFVFRTAGFWVRSRAVWTVKDAIRHIDRHPEDGIYHIRNGTFVRWLYDQGAVHVAAMLNSAFRSVISSPRAMLETFLIETGVVRRPNMAIHPKTLDLGQIQAGSVGTGQMEIRQERGRGYLFGQLRPGDACMSVMPSTFSGPHSVVAVRVDTQTMPISREPYEVVAEVISIASAEVMRVPVRFKVVGAVPAARRLFMQPLATLLSAGAIGVLIGWLLTLTGSVPRAAVWTTRGLDQVIPGEYAAVAIFGLFWATLGAVIGFRLPATWSLVDTTRHWMSRAALWMFALFAIGGLSYFAIDLLTGTDLSVRRYATVGLAGAAFAILPIALAGTPLSKAPPSTAMFRRPRFGPRNTIAIGALLLIFAIIFVGFHQADRLAVPKEVAYEWTEAKLAYLDTQLRRMGDDLLLQYYDRRAPSRAPAPSTEPKKRVPAGSGLAPAPPVRPAFPQ